jgi:hypothetical protein
LIPLVNNTASKSDITVVAGTVINTNKKVFDSALRKALSLKALA